MGLNTWKLKFIYWGLAALAVSMILSGMCVSKQSEKQACKIVYFGDSVPGIVRDESGIPAMVSRLLGEEVSNFAFGGTCVGRISVDQNPDIRKEAISLVALTKAILAEDFGPQQTLRFREAVTEGYEYILDDLEQIDFKRVETVIIEQGVNDYFSEIPLSNPSNPMDEYSYCGALRTSIETLRRVNPKLRIILVTPTYVWRVPLGLDCEEYATSCGTLEDYVEEELRVAEECGVEIIDIYHDFYPHEGWEDWEIYTTDGIHPNEAGREKIAGKISEYLGGEAK